MCLGHRILDMDMNLAILLAQIPLNPLLKKCSNFLEVPLNFLLSISIEMFELPFYPLVRSSNLSGRSGCRLTVSLQIPWT